MIKLIAIILLFSNCSLASENNYQEGMQKATEAFYVQSGLSVMLDNKVRDIRQRMPGYCNKSLDIIVPLVDTVIKRRVELRYEF